MFEILEATHKAYEMLSVPGLLLETRLGRRPSFWKSTSLKVPGR